MKRSTVILQHLWPRNSVDLSLFVRNPKEPNQGSYRSPKIDSYSEFSCDYGVSQALGYEDLVGSSTELGFGAKALDFFRALFQIDKEDQSGLDAKVVRTYVLNDQDGKFSQIVKEGEGRKWIEQCVKKGKSVYMVVGYQTVCKVRFNDQNKDSYKVDASAKARDPHTTQGVEVSAKGTKSSNRGAKFRIDDEQIYSVQYRKVVWNFFSSKDVDKADLDENDFWVVSWKTRGNGEGTGGDDVLKVSLSDDATFDDDPTLIFEPSGDPNQPMYFSQ